jgi:hypothetical protein
LFRCVLRSDGCVLVRRSSGTPVATWAWPTWVVSRRRVLEAVFILLELPSPSRRIFIGSHSLPPLWFAVSVLQVVSEQVRAYQERGSGPPHFDDKNYEMGAFLRRKGQILWDVTVDTGYVQPMDSSLQDRGTDSTPTIRRSTTCFVLWVSLSSIGCTPSTWLVEFGQF